MQTTRHRNKIPLGIRVGLFAPMAHLPEFGFISSPERIKKRMRCRYSHSYFCLRPSANFIVTYLPSQSSHLNNAFFYYSPASLFPFFFQLSIRRRAFCFQKLVVGLLKICIRACCRLASTANTARQGAIGPAQSSKASTCRP